MGKGELTFGYRGGGLTCRRCAFLALSLGARSVRLLSCRLFRGGLGCLLLLLQPPPLVFRSCSFQSASQFAVCEKKGGNLRAGPPRSRRATTRGAGGSSSRAFRSLTCSSLAPNSLLPRSPRSVTVTVVCSLVGVAAKVSLFEVGRGPSKTRAGPRDPRQSGSSPQGPRADPKACARR
jgi:hypothetical protein